MLSWPRQIPIEGEPKNVCKIVSEYSDWMSKNNMPKLFINAEPGAIIKGLFVIFVELGIIRVKLLLKASISFKRILQMK